MARSEKGSAKKAKNNKKKVVSKGSSSGNSASGELSRRSSGSLSHQDHTFTIGALETALLEQFPREDAESWDRTGLLVGEPSSLTTKVAVALDPTVASVCKASNLGANVLVTHHPAYLNAPTAFAPEPSCALSSGAVVWSAIQNQVALMNFHTALDVSEKAARVLPSMLGLTFEGKLIEPIASTQHKGYGQICTVSAKVGNTDTLKNLAARCTSVFGRQPRVWGNFDASISRVVTATGSLGSVGKAALCAGIDCVICGEVKYHEALDLSLAGLCIIELGHDVSELPLVAVLADTLLQIGVSENKIVVIDQTDNWHYPEAIRM